MGARKLNTGISAKSVFVFVLHYPQQFLLDMQHPPILTESHSYLLAGTYHI